MNHNGYYAQALDVIAGSINSPHRSGKTLAMLQSIERDTAQAVAIEREAIAGWLIRNAHSEDMWAIDDMLTAIAQAIRSGEHVKP